MTLEPPHAEERGRKDPVELVARALCVATKPAPASALHVQVGDDAWDLLTSWAGVELEGGDLGYIEEVVLHACRERAEFLTTAQAALAALGKHGYLSMSYYDWRREQQKDETR